MSSKLHRGGDVATEPVTWRRVPSLDALPEGGLFPSAGYTLPPSGPVSHAGSTLEQHLQGAYQQGFQDGQNTVQQELGDRSTPWRPDWREPSKRYPVSANAIVTKLKQT